MSKTKFKFQVGDMVKASSKIGKHVFTYWAKNRPISPVRLSDEQTKTLKNTDIAIVISKKRSWYSKNEYEVRFMQTGIKVILPEEQLKWAK